MARRNTADSSSRDWEDDDERDRFYLEGLLIRRIGMFGALVIAAVLLRLNIIL